MSGDVVNLNKARKAKVRAETSAKAVANRVQFGRTKTERTIAEAEATKAARLLDGHKRESSEKT